MSTAAFLATVAEIETLGTISRFSHDPAQVARRATMDALIARADAEASAAGITLGRTPGCAPSIATILAAAAEMEG